MSLSNLTKTKSRSKKRVGRGIGSGKGGHTSGRGQKGQTSRSGNQIRAGFEGGQNPLFKRLPKKPGTRMALKTPSEFLKPRIVEKLQVSLGFLGRFEEGSTITRDILLTAKRCKDKNAYIKVIDAGELKKKVNIEGIKVTKGAAAKIEKLGGKIS